MGPEDLQVAEYTETTKLSDWAFALKAPPRGAFPFATVMTKPPATEPHKC